MNKLITKIVGATLGVTMAVGVGIGIAISGQGFLSPAYAADVTDELTAGKFEATSTTYKDFSGVTATSNAVYAGNSAKTSSGGIQLRSKSNSGIVSTASGGTVKSVTITVESGSNTVDVYGSNTAYSGAGDLYGSSTQGTKVGSASENGTITFTDSYSYVGIRSNNGALYLTKIEIVWTTAAGNTSESQSQTSSSSSATSSESSSSSSQTSSSSEAPAAKYTEDTTNKTITWNLAEASYDSITTTDAQWSSPKVTVAAAQASATTATNNYCPPTQNSTRFYKNSTLTFTPASGYKINSIVAQATTQGYATALSGSTWTNATASADTTTFVVTITASNSGVVSATLTNTTGLTSIVVYYGVPRTLTTLTSVTATVSASSADSNWTITNKTVMGRYSDSVADEDVTNECNVSVVTAFPTIAASGSQTVTVRAESKTNNTIYVENANITATLTFVDEHSIQYIYANKEDGDSIDFDGVYMGDVRDGIEIMNGAYGMCVYYGNDSVPNHDYVAGTTKLHVTGTLEISKNLYRVENDANTRVVEEQTNVSRLNNIVTPVIYQLSGNESTSDLTVANRKTYGIGVVKTITDTANGGHKNLTFHITGTDESKTIKVFAANAFLSESVVTALETSQSEGTEITIEGFTSFYTDFQVQFTGVIAASASYHAVNFAQDLLNLTNDDCSNYDPVNNPNPNNISALAETWVELQNNQHYYQLSKDDRDDLVEANAVDHANPQTDQQIIEKAMARYEMLVSKYGADKYGNQKLSDFIGRSVTINNGSRITSLASDNGNNISAIIIIVVSTISLTSVGLYFLIRRRKEQ